MSSNPSPKIGKVTVHLWNMKYSCHLYAIECPRTCNKIAISSHSTLILYKNFESHSSDIFIVQKYGLLNPY